MRAPNSGGNSQFLLTLAVASVSAGLSALLIIAFPFWGDQALHQVIGRMLEDGATLYVDAWDVKQPAIFLFHQVAGRLFSFSAPGVHLLETLYIIGTSIWIAVAMRRYVSRPWVAGLFPVVGATWYFLSATYRDLTQVEVLVSPLVAGVALCLAGADSSGRGFRRAVLGGLLTGGIIWMKSLEVLIPLAMLLVSYVLHRRAGKTTRWARVTLAPFAIGMAFPVVALAGWIAVNSLWAETWFTWIEVPILARGVGASPISRLVTSTSRFAGYYALPGLLALVGIARHRSALRWLLATALGAGFVLISLQFHWQYHFYILMMPLGVLALLGLDTFATVPKKWLLTGVAVIALAFAPLRLAIIKTTQMSDLLDSPSLAAFHARFSSVAIAGETSALISPDLEDTVYVLGDPSIHLILEKDLGVPINGWSPEVWPGVLWDRATRDLTVEEVDYVFVSTGARLSIDQLRPTFLRDALDGYSVVVESDNGVWYHRG